MPIASIAALLFLIVGAPAALAAPGDNGDVKVHASTTAVGDERDDTHVCLFYLDAFNFDTIQQVSWKINQQPPTGHAQVASGTITLHNGVGHTANMSLPAGHYKLTWTFTGEHGSAKHKDFWSNCVVSSPSPSASASQSASPSPSVSTSGSACPTCHSPSPSPTQSQSASTSASAMPSVSGSMMGSPGASHGPGGGKLAQTGISLLPVAGGAAALVLTGALLTRRSRKSAHTR